MKHTLTPVRLAVLSALAALGSLQTSHAQQSLPDVLITGNPLARPDGVVPASKLSGDELTVKRQSTIGETLNALPGVSSSYFGPNASRPIIRGLDGDRIRVLQNSGALLDASSLSYDHAVPVDPISIDRIEVLRGSAALLYGGSAAGGVVNLIDNRVAREPVFSAKGGASGALNLGLGSNRLREAGFRLDGGTDRFVLHVDGFSKKAGDIATPQALCDDPATGTSFQSRRLCNSASKSDGAGLGATLLFDRGYLGTSFSHYASNYGTVAEPEVTIDMRNQRWSLEGEWRAGGLVDSVKGQLNLGKYRHTELDAGTPATTFRNKGADARFDVRHRAFNTGMGVLQGTVGLQWDRNTFDAEGSEAFAPRSKTAQSALFLYEELSTSFGRYNAGLRVEGVSVESLGSDSTTRFDANRGKKTFKPVSQSIGANWPIGKQWEVSANLANSQRAPKDYELFADGPHIATAAYEIGDPSLTKEKSLKAEIGIGWKNAGHRVNANLFTSKFRNYIGLSSSANQRGLDGELNPADLDGDGVADASGEEILPEYVYKAVKARFRGLELNGNFRLLPGARKLDLAWKADLLRATNLDTGEALPRIAPMRLGATLNYAVSGWRARIGFEHSASQKRVPAGERSTESYTLWNTDISYLQKLSGSAELLWFVRVDNIGNKKAFSASSILTQTAPDKSPLPGRSVKMGVQGRF